MSSQVDFKAFVDQQYKGIPDRTTTVEQKERAIKAKKAILNHPDCPNDSKAKIREEIKTIESEIKAIKSEERNKSMNSSIFD